MNKNHCYRKCKYFNDKHVCKSLQKEQNCYQCIVTNYNFKTKELRRAKLHIVALEKENQELKMLLADKVLKEWRCDIHGT